MSFFSKIIFLLIFNFFFVNLNSIDLPNSLVIKTLKNGDKNSKLSQKKDILSVNYSGWIFDENIDTKDFCKAKGNMFDSNIIEKFNHVKSFEFLLGKGVVINGWDDGLTNMKVNEKRCLVIPPRFAYGNRRIGDIIKPNSTLIFEVELLEIIKP